MVPRVQRTSQSYILIDFEVSIVFLSLTRLWLSSDDLAPRLISNLLPASAFNSHGITSIPFDFDETCSQRRTHLRVP